MSFYCFNLPSFIIGGQTIFVHWVSVFLFSHITSSCVLPIFLFLKLLFYHISSPFMSFFCLTFKILIIKVCSTHPSYLKYATHVQFMTLSSAAPKHRTRRIQWWCSFSNSPTHTLTSTTGSLTETWNGIPPFFHLSTYSLELFLKVLPLHKVSSNCTGFFNFLNSQYQGIQNLTVLSFI